MCVFSVAMMMTHLIWGEGGEEEGVEERERECVALPGTING